MTTEEALATFAGRFGASQYRPVFGRTFLSEMRKLNTRAILITIVLALIFHGGLTFVIANPKWASDAGPNIVTTLTTFLTLFTLLTGTLAVTSEYSHNTMRTTALADPIRTRSYFAKLAASGAVNALLAMTFVVVGMAIALIRIPGLDVWHYGWRPFIAMFLFLVMTGWMATGFGYLLRSTAGTISVMVALLFFVDLLTLVPRDFFRITLPQFMPLPLIQFGTIGSLPVPREEWLYTEPWVGVGIYAIYTAIVVAAGWLAYRRRDI